MTDRNRTPASTARTVGRIALGGILVFAGISHLTFARDDFRAQVPEFVPLKEDTTVLLSGVAEISLGSALLFAPTSLRGKAGLLAATFFTAIFPGNIAQAVHHKDAFGLDTDAKRIGRLFGQPVLVAWALWSTGALLRGSAPAERAGRGAAGTRWSSGHTLVERAHAG